MELKTGRFVGVGKLEDISSLLIQKRHHSLSDAFLEMLFDMSYAGCVSISVVTRSSVL